MSAEPRTISVYELGLTGYGEVHRLQQRLQAQRREGGGVDTLILTEHRPVMTLGRSHPEPNLRAPAAALAEEGIEVVQTERGGDITYHGPGQLVAYGIVDLKGWDCSVIDFVSGLEQTVMGVLADHGIEGEANVRGRGVWAGGRKIASLGLNVRRWVTMHGIALNVDPEMEHFALINPCGMPDVEMTSMAREVELPVSMEEVCESFKAHFARAFACDVATVELPSRRAAG
jgi:lipoate-protein ligase B